MARKLKTGKGNNKLARQMASAKRPLALLQQQRGSIPRSQRVPESSASEFTTGRASPDRKLHMQK